MCSACMPRYDYWLTTGGSNAVMHMQKDASCRGLSYQSKLAKFVFIQQVQAQLHAVNNDESHLFWIHLLLHIQAHLHIVTPPGCQIWSTHHFESPSNLNVKSLVVNKSCRDTYLCNATYLCLISPILHVFLNCYRWYWISHCVLQSFHYFHNSLVATQVVIRSKWD